MQLTGTGRKPQRGLSQKLVLVSLLLVLLAGATAAAEETLEGDAAQANNPLADIRAFNLQNYYIPELSGPGDETANSFILRYAQPFGNWLMRASLPFNRVPTGPGETASGLGDLDVFFAYLFDTGNPGRSFGFGPQFVLPTASRDATGSGQWQAGAAAVYFDATSSLFQWGGLVTYRTDIAGDDDRDDTSVLAAQPFYFLQLGGGNYLRGAPIWVFDLENDTYHVPVGLGFGRVIPTERIVFNVFIEPQFTILDKGPGQPEFQLFLGFNMQFK
ncbi:MAG: hypothetical protein AAGE43_14120 [Pseudomonadota bacterium]